MFQHGNQPLERRNSHFAPEKTIGLWIQKDRNFIIPMSNHWCSGAILVSGIPWWDDMMLESPDDEKCNVSTNVDCWECKVNLPPKSCVRLVLCCMVYVFYAYFDCFGTSLPHLSLGWRFTWGPCSLKISGGEVNPPCSSKTQSPRARNFKCESRSLSHGIIFDSPIQPSNLKSNPLNLQYTRWALQSLQVKLLEPQNNWVCMGTLIHPTYSKKNISSHLQLDPGPTL